MKALLVEDSPADARLIREMLRETGEAFQCERVERLDAALERLHREQFDVVLLDLGLPDAEGMDTLTLMHHACGGVPIVVLTGRVDEQFALEAMRAGAQDYLVKGRFDHELLGRSIGYAVQRKRAEEEVRRLNAELERRVAERTLELREAYEALRQGEERLAAIINNAMDAIVTVDEEQRILMFNAAAEQTFGCSAFEVIGQPLDRLLPGRFRAVHRQHVDTYGVTGRSDRSMQAPGSFVGLRANGDEFPLEATVSQATIGGQKFYTAILRDITQRKQAEEMAKLYAQTRELDQVKTEFFSNISHELRTPLALILGPVRKTLDSPDLTDTARHDLEVVERNAALMLRHVNDLLDLSKLDAGRMTAEYASTDLVHHGRLVASYFDVLASERGLRYEIDIPPSLPAEIDPPKIERVFVNLLSNAFKFTPPGGAVRFAMRAEADRAIVEVDDTGPGIPSDLRDAIFDRFQQLERGPGRPAGGTGLGLSIAKQFVTLHGGDISVGPRPDGIGSLFRVELPLSAPSGRRVRPPMADGDQEAARLAVSELAAHKATTTPSGPSPNTSAAVVLVIDDQPAMNAFISETLSARYRVVPAFNGQDGLDTALKIHPDLIVCDIMMPDVPGDEFVRELRKRADFDDVPIVLVTAKADERLLVQLLAEGAQDYLRKPFAADELLAKTERLIADRARLGEELGRLHQLAGRLLHSDNEQRRNVAHNLHENIVQSLAALRMNLAFARKADKSIDPTVRRVLDDGLVLLEDVCSDICAMSTELHPSLLDMFGLSAAIESHVKSLTYGNGMKVAVDIPREFGRLDPESELVLFRIAQDALATAASNGRTTAALRLVRDAAEVRLEVSGTDPNADVESMRERARMVGGRLETSADDNRATIRAVVPSRERQPD
jgi:PAS domain S-box-containing protein